MLIIAIGLFYAWPHATSRAKSTAQSVTPTAPTTDARALAMLTHTSPSPPPPTSLKTCLADIHRQLSNIQRNMGQSHTAPSQLMAINTQLSQLTQSVTTMAQQATDLQQATQATARHVSQTQQATTNQLDQLQHQLHQLTNQMTPANTLPASVLPFKLVGVDFWNGHPMASIAMRDMNGVIQYKLMGEGMVFHCQDQSRHLSASSPAHNPSAVLCRDWTLTTIDLNATTRAGESAIAVTFHDPQGQSVREVLP